MKKDKEISTLEQSCINMINAFTRNKPVFKQACVNMVNGVNNNIIIKKKEVS